VDDVVQVHSYIVNRHCENTKFSKSLCCTPTVWKSQSCDKYD